MALKLNVPQHNILKPKIVVFGTGGAGGNAINNMIRSNLEGVEFVAANTDAQALSHSLAPSCIQLGVEITKGLGAGSFPDRGKAAAEESIAEIEKHLEDCHMVFIAAGMGGGTGTGAAPVIAKMARERDILTVGVVTKPFHFEGRYRMQTAESGIEDLRKYVDTLIVIPNQNLFRVANERTTFESAFKMADDVLHSGVRGVTDLITMPGLVNLDFADIKAIMSKMGKAMMGTGEAEGENRAILACEAAISNPLLDDVSIKGAKGVLVNMTGGPDMTLFEADMAVNSIKKEVDPNANIIFGSAFNENMNGKIRISVVATGINTDPMHNENSENDKLSKFKVNLSDSSASEHNTQRSRVVKESRLHPNFPNFFDPGITTKPTEERIEEISGDDFKPRRNYSKEPNPTYGNDATVRSEEESFSQMNFAEEEPHLQHNHKKSSLTVAVEKPAHQEVEEVTEKPVKKVSKNKKDSGGFSLFSFMGGSKNKEDDDAEMMSYEDYEKQESDNRKKHKPHAKHSTTHETKSHQLENEVYEIDDFLPNADKKKSSQHHNHDAAPKKAAKSHSKRTVFDDADGGDHGLRHDDEHHDEDDILNVPAFFRRKKS